MLKSKLTQNLRPTLSASVALISLFALSACAKQAPAPQTSEGLVSRIEVSTSEEAQRLQNESAVQCENAGDCNPHVGLITYIKNSGLMTCTGTLITPTVVATNRHCIPDDLSSFRFQLPRSEKRLPAIQVLSASEDPGQSSVAQDYAFVEIQASGTHSAFPSLARQELNDGLQTQVYKVDPPTAVPDANGVLKLSTAIQRKIVCQINLHSPILEGTDQPIRKLVLMDDCTGTTPIQPGNSGSPVFVAAPNGSVQLVSIVAGFNDLTDGARTLRAFRATHLACVPQISGIEAQPIANLSASCDHEITLPNFARILQEASQARQQASLRQIRAQMRPVSGGSLQNVHWASGTVSIPFDTGSTLALILAPSCANAHLDGSIDTLRWTGPFAVLRGDITGPNSVRYSSELDTQTLSLAASFERLPNGQIQMQVSTGGAPLLTATVEECR